MSEGTTTAVDDVQHVNYEDEIEWTPFEERWSPFEIRSGAQKQEDYAITKTYFGGYTTLADRQDVMLPILPKDPGPWRLVSVVVVRDTLYFYWAKTTPRETFCSLYK